MIGRERETYVFIRRDGKFFVSGFKIFLTKVDTSMTKHPSTSDGEG